MADKTETETLPPAMDAETGVAMDGEFPHNHRLRAEAMAAAGVETDEAGLISDELIADAKERLAREKAAAEKAVAGEKRASKATDKGENPPADSNTADKGA